MEMTLQRRNPGPSWGYAFLSAADRILPRRAMDLCLGIGSWVALAAMPRQRRHSREFLGCVRGGKVGWTDSWRHFFAFARFLMERFRAARGAEPRFRPSGEGEDRMEALASKGEQALYGTFHFGMSDLMGFWLSKFDLSVRMVRFQVGNSDDIAWLERRFGEKVGFLWVNDPANLLFALKEAAQEGHSIAMKCDRAAHSSKLDVFAFLGQRRLFPFAIYHLSLLFGLPVVFAFGLPSEEGDVVIHSSTVFRPANGESKARNMERARQHFRGVLSLLERLVREQPYQWFNFTDALPLATAEDAAHGRRQAGVSP